jgi:hypothetical protein
VLSFVDRPLLAGAVLGADGLRGPGAQVSWLVPAPFYLELFGEALSVRAEEEPTGGMAMEPPPVPGPPPPSFGGGAAEDLTYASALKTFVALSETHSLLLGASYATGLSGDQRSHVVGGDLTYKYKPVSRAEGYRELTLQSEYLHRSVPARDEQDGSLYAELVLRLTRRWHAGVRFDLLGAPRHPSLSRVTKLAPVLSFSPSEFSRLRVQYAAEFPATGTVIHAAFLQVEFNIGPHGAHPF